MPGSGVRGTNILSLAAQTKCHEFHTSLRELKKSAMSFFPPAFEQNEENNHYSIDEEKVRQLKNILAHAF